MSDCLEWINRLLFASSVGVVDQMFNWSLHCVYDDWVELIYGYALIESVPTRLRVLKLLILRVNVQVFWLVWIFPKIKTLGLFYVIKIMIYFSKIINFFTKILVWTVLTKLPVLITLLTA